MIQVGDRAKLRARAIREIEVRGEAGGEFRVPYDAMGDVVGTVDGAAFAGRQYRVAWDAAFPDRPGVVTALAGVVTEVPDGWVRVAMQPVQHEPAPDLDATARALDDRYDDEAMFAVMGDPMDASLDLDDDDPPDHEIPMPPGWEDLRDNPWIVVCQHRDGHRIAGRWHDAAGVWRFGILSRSAAGSDGRAYKTAAEALQDCQHDIDHEIDRASAPRVTPHPDRPATADGELPDGWREDCYGDAYAPDGSCVGYEPKKRHWFIVPGIFQSLDAPARFTLRSDAIACLRRNLAGPAGEDRS